MTAAIKRAFLRFSGEDPAAVLSALARRLCADARLAIDLALPEPPQALEHAVRALAQTSDPAELLIDAREALLSTGERRARGAHFTPHAIAHRLAALALEAAPAGRALSICDPACGAGTFLVAAYREGAARGLDLAGGLWGSDVDALSVEVSRVALCLATGEPRAGADRRIVCGDPLVGGRSVWAGAGGGFDVIVGNPPFLNQLRRASVRSAEESAQLAAALSIGSQPYADTSALFLARSVEMLAGGGVVALIQPQSLLASRDAAEVRNLIDAQAPLVGLWLARKPVFAASVRVCAPIARKGTAATAVRRFVDAGFHELAPVPRDQFGTWAALAASAAGVPHVEVEGLRTLRDVGCRATAGFRDQYYGLVGAVREGGEGPRLVTAGIIEPLDLQWGTRAVAFAKESFQRPFVALDAVDPAISGWITARLRPKVLVATQTRVIEAVVDTAGDCVPSTPVIEVVSDEVPLWQIAAVLTNPVTTAVALGRAAGSALAFDSLKLSAQQVLDLPVPSDLECWRRAAEIAEGAASATTASTRRDLLGRLGAEMCTAYGAPPELAAWWLARLR